MLLILLSTPISLPDFNSATSLSLAYSLSLLLLPPPVSLLTLPHPLRQLNQRKIEKKYDSSTVRAHIESQTKREDLRVLNPPSLSF